METSTLNQSQTMTTNDPNELVLSRTLRKEEYDKYLGKDGKSALSSGFVASTPGELANEYGDFENYPVTIEDRIAAEAGNPISSDNNIKNATLQFLIGMNEVQAKNTQGRLSRTIMPELRRLDKNISNIQAIDGLRQFKSDILRAMSELEVNDPNRQSQEWNALNQELINTNTQIEQIRGDLNVSGVDNTVIDSIDKNSILEDWTNKKLDLEKQRDELAKDVETDEADVKYWKENSFLGKQDENYLARQAQLQDPNREKTFNPFNENFSLRDLAFHDLPGLMGSSSTNYIWQSAPYALTMLRPLIAKGAAKLLVSTAAGAAAGSVVPGAGTVAGGTAGALVGHVMNAYTLGVGLVGIGSSIAQGYSEANAETFDAYSGAVETLLNESGHSLQFYDNLRASEGLSEAEKELDNKQLLDRILDGRIQYSDPQFDYIRDVAEQEQSKLFAQNMAITTTSNIVGNALALPMWGKMFGRKIGKAATDAGQIGEMILDPFGGAVDVTRDWAKGQLNKYITARTVQSGMGSVLKGAMRTAVPVANVAGIGLASGTNEMFEEGAQYVAGDDFAGRVLERFKTGDKSDGGDFWSNLPDATVSSYVNKGKVLGSIFSAAFGMDALYANDIEFWNNVKLGFLGGAASMQHIPMYYGAAKEGIQEANSRINAGEFVKNSAIDEIQHKEDFTRAMMYASGKVKGMEQQVLETYQMMLDKNKIPEGLTKEDIQNEINFASSAMNLAASQKMQDLSVRLGITPDTEEYGKLIGLAMTAEKDANTASKQLHAAGTKYAQAANSTLQNLGEATLQKVFKPLKEEASTILKTANETLLGEATTVEDVLAGYDFNSGENAIGYDTYSQLLLGYRSEQSLNSLINEIESTLKAETSEMPSFNGDTFSKAQLGMMLESAKAQLKEIQNTHPSYNAIKPALEKANQRLDAVLPTDKLEALNSSKMALNAASIRNKMHNDIATAFFGIEPEQDYSEVHKLAKKKIRKEQLKSGKTIELSKADQLVKDLYDLQGVAANESKSQWAQTVGVKEEPVAAEKAPVSSPVMVGGKVMSKERAAEEAAQRSRDLLVPKPQPVTQPAARGPRPEGGEEVALQNSTDDLLARARERARSSDTGSQLTARPTSAKASNPKRKRTPGKLVAVEDAQIPTANASGVEKIADQSAEAAFTKEIVPQNPNTTASTTDNVTGKDPKSTKKKKQSTASDPFAGMTSTAEEGSNAVEATTDQSIADSKSEYDKLVEAKDALGKEFIKQWRDLNNLGFAYNPEDQARKQRAMFETGYKLIQSYFNLGLYKFQQIAKDIFNSAQMFDGNVSDYSDFHDTFRGVYTAFYYEHPDKQDQIDNPQTIFGIEVEHITSGTEIKGDPIVEQQVIEDVETQFKESALSTPSGITTEDLMEYSPFSRLGFLNTFQYDPRDRNTTSHKFDGKTVNFEANNELAPLLSEGAKAFEFEYKVIDFDSSKGVDPNKVQMGAIATHVPSGKKFWLRLKSTQDYKNDIAANKVYLDPSEIEIIDEELTPARQSLLDKLLDEKGNPVQGVVVRPDKVLFHHAITSMGGNGRTLRLSINDAGYSNVFKISTDWEAELENFAVSKGLRSADRGVFTLGEQLPVVINGHAFESDRMGQLFYVIEESKRDSGRALPVEISRSTYRMYPQLIDALTDIIFTYGMGPQEVSYNGTDLYVSDILGMFVNIGMHTRPERREGMSPAELAAHQVLLNKQLHVYNGILTFGTTSVPLSGHSEQSLTELKRAFKEWFATNVTFPIQLDIDTSRPTISMPISEISKGRLAKAINAAPNGKLVLAKGIEFSKADLNKPYIQWAYENEMLLTDINATTYNQPYVILEGSVTNKARMEAIKNAPIDKTPTNPTVTEPEQVQKDSTTSGVVEPIKVPVTSDASPESKARAKKLKDKIKEKRTASFRINNPDQPHVHFTPIKGNIKEKPMQIEKEVRFLKEVMGMNDTEIQIMDLALASGNPTAAVSHMTADAIVLSSNDPDGVAYHEAWHRVNLLLHTEAEREAAYGAYRLKNKSTKRLPNHIVEELMAEDFRSHGLNNIPSWSYRITKFFDKVRDFLGVLSPAGQLRQVYDKIYEGQYRNIKPTAEAKARFTAAYGNNVKFTRHGVKFKNIHSLFSYYSMVNFVLTEQINTNIEEGLFTSQDAIFNIDYVSVKELFLENANDPDFTEEQQKVSQELYDNFEAVKRDMIDMLATKGFRERMFVEEDNESNDGTFDEDDNGDTTKENFDKYDRAAYESPKLKEIRPAVKFFLSSIPAITEVSAGNYQYVFNKEHGFPEYVPFNEVWSELSNNVFDSEKYSEILDKVRTLSDKNPLFASLYNKLTEVEDVNLQTNLFHTLTGYKHNFEVVGFSKEGKQKTKTYKVSLDGGSTAKLAKNVVAQWNENFYNSDLVIMQEGGRMIGNSKLAKSLSKDYTDLASQIAIAAKTETGENDFMEYLILLNNILNQSGIDIDLDAMQSHIDSIKTPGESNIKALSRFYGAVGKGSFRNSFLESLSFVATGNSKNKKYPKTLDRVYSSEHSFQSLGMAQYNQTRNDVEQRVLGPKNKSLYPFSKHNNFTLEITRLNNNKDYVGRLLEVPYNKTSLVLNFLRGSNKYVSIGTFANFTEFSVGSKGSDYREAGRLETFIIKFAYSEANALLLPTMSDKKTYMPIHGLPLFAMRSMLNTSTEGEVQQEFSKDVIQLMDGYYIAEYNAIAQYNRLKDVEDQIPVNKKYLRYFGQKGKQGSGGKFRHAKGYYRTDETGKIQYHPFSKMTDVEIEAYFAESNKEQRYSDLQNMLFNKLNRQLKYMSDLGLITSKAGVYSNISLPNKSVVDRIEAIKKTITGKVFANTVTDAAIRWAAADYLVNHMVSMEEAGKILHKDPAYYKDASAVTKRLAGALSTGEMLRTDFPAEHWFNSIPRYRKGKFNVVAVSDVMTKTNQPKEVYESVYNAYVNEMLYVAGDHTIEEINNIMANPEYKYGSDLIPKEIHLAAKKATESDLKPYGDITMSDEGILLVGDDNPVNQADGAAYCSPQFAKALLLATGNFPKHVEEAFDILENDPDVLKDPKKYGKVLGVAMSPFKMVYYGSDPLTITVNGVQEVINPITFNKMAIFPVFKYLATGDLRAMYDTMNDAAHPIDLITTGSATKTDNIISYPFYTDNSQTEISKFFTSGEGRPIMEKKSQSFRNLLNQMPIHPHEEERRMLVTQAAKTILSNIRLDDTYILNTGNDQVAVTGKELHEIVNRTQDRLSDLGLTKILNSWNIVKGVDSSGVPTYRFEEYSGISEKLMRDFSESQLDPSIAKALTLKPNGEFSTPLSATPIAKQLVSKLISAVNKETIDMNLPGGAYIQMSSFGFKGISAKKFSEKDLGEYIFNNGDKLKLVNKNGTMDAGISINAFLHVIPEDKRGSFDEMRNYLLDRRIIGPSAKPSAIGYRVPTQGLSSIAALTIRDVFPAEYGDIIVLPDEFTARTGSDKISLFD